MNQLDENKSSWPAVWPLLLNGALVALMMTCFAAVSLFIFKRAQPEWQSNYLIAVSLVVTIEAMVTARQLRDQAIMGPEWITARVVEFVVGLVTLKGLIYLLRGPGQLLSDLHLWQQNFFQNFFSGEILPALAVVLPIWALANAYSNALENLEEDHQALDLERQGYIPGERGISRRKIIGLIFGQGIFMMAVLTLVNTDLPFIQTDKVVLSPAVTWLALFFLLGFGLLAQTQYVIQSARWYVQNIPFSARIARSWAPYSLVLIFIVALIVIFLPTQYSMGLLEAIQYLISLLFLLFGILQVLIISPILAFLRLLMGLFGGGQPEQAPQTSTLTLPEVVLQPGGPQGTPLLWVEGLKSILFWITFLAVIILAFRYYFNQNRHIVRWIKQFPLFRFLSGIWGWLRQGWVRTSKGVGEKLKMGLARLRAAQKKRSPRFNWISAISSKLPARQQILLTYLVLVSSNERYAIHRKPYQSPYEYADLAGSLCPAINVDMQALTHHFIEARYTRHALSGEMAAEARACLKRIQSSLAENDQKIKEQERAHA